MKRYNIICPTYTPCDEITPPYINLSAEGPDEFEYVGNPIYIDGGFPPLGSIWRSWGCIGECVSTISQADADQCAINQKILCEFDECANPPCNVIDPDTGQPYVLYRSYEQTATAKCPDGTDFYWTVPYGTFISISQKQANQLAYNKALAQVKAHMVCLSGLSGPCTTDGTIKLYITATGADVDPGLLGAGSNIWRLVSGTLPTGMRLLVQSVFDIDWSGMPGGPTITLEGTPATPGVYIFTISVTTGAGSWVSKTYEVEVLADITQNTYTTMTLTAPACAYGIYSNTLTGYVSNGMVWSKDPFQNDIISGTPNTVGVCAFTITYA